MTVRPSLFLDTPAGFGAPASPPDVPAWSLAWATWVQLGFDTCRHQHAVAARTGWMPASLLASASLEQRLASAERMVLGDLARRV